MLDIDGDKRAPLQQYGANMQDLQGLPVAVKALQSNVIA